jgi:hypothetical protein
MFSPTRHIELTRVFGVFPRVDSNCLVEPSRLALAAAALARSNEPAQ